jgi:hypothetical protein
MLHKCANPACPSLFRSLSLGKLFVLETDFGEGFTPPRSRRHRSLRRMERYWLCDGCSSLLTLTFERGRGMITVPLPARNRRVPALHLTGMQGIFPRELKGVL